jgi:hypothetical protein
VINEVLTGYDGSADVQFIEMRTLAGGQSLVRNSVLAAFDDSGDYIADILILPANLTNSGSGVRYLIGTAAFQTTSGVTADFVMPPGILPVSGGMVCFGGGGGVVPQNPSSWSRTAFSTYVDCVAYGTYHGPTNPRIGTATSLDGNGHSLQRIGQTQNNANDFTCGDPATPQNNAAATGSLAATAPCGSGATPTPTETQTPGMPSPTATLMTAATETPTVTPTGTPGQPLACVADCNNNGSVALDEVIRAVNISLGTVELATCEAADADRDGFAAIDELVRAVASSVNGCASAG